MEERSHDDLIDGGSSWIFRFNAERERERDEELKN